MNRPLIFDVSAAWGLLDGHPVPVTLLELGVAGQRIVCFPSTVIAEISTTPGSWDGILVPKNVVVLELTEAVAKELGRGDMKMPLTVRHTVFEAERIDGLVVTCTPNLYSLDTPLFTF